MQRTYIKNANKGEVKVSGWAEEIRNIGKLLFIKLRDQTGYVQIVVKKNDSEDIFNKLKELTKESVISVKGEVKENNEAPGGKEIVPTEAEILADSEPLPIDFSGKADTTFDKLLDFRTLSMRNQENVAIFKIQSCLLHGFREYLDENDYMQVFTPCLMGVASESGSEVFKLDYFDKQAFMRQDPQLHRQLTIACGLENIYELGPAWRAEQSHTSRHLCEHRVLAVEKAFIKDEFEVMKIEQEMIKHALKKLQKECSKELEMFNVELNIPDEIPVLQFPDIYEILKKYGKEFKKGEDYDTESEMYLYEYVKEKYGSDFFFVNKFPYDVKPFYVMRYPDTPWARSVDLIFKGVELSSGGQREHRYDYIKKQAKEKDMSDDSVEWFAKFFKYGVPPHGGFALGIERFTKQLLGIDNIRKCTIFPRDTERLVP